MPWTPESPLPHPGSPRRRPEGRAVGTPNGAVLELMTREEGFADAPLGGWAGETLPPTAPAQTTRQQGLVIPPPPWHGEGPPAAPPPAPEPDPPGSMGARALAELRAQHGEEAFIPPPPGPPAVWSPLVPVKVPQADWRAEELARLARDEHALDEEAPSAYPPPRREPA